MFSGRNPGGLGSRRNSPRGVPCSPIPECGDDFLNAFNYGLSSRQLALLDEILELTWKSGALVEIADFRAAHPGDRSELDKLVSRSMLARDGHGILYRVEILGLDALANTRARTLLHRGDVLAKELRRRFGDKTLRKTPYPFSEIGQLWGVTPDERTLTLIHFKDIFYLWGVGLVNDFNSPDAALTLGGEGILDNPNVDAIIDQLREWTFARDREHKHEIPQTHAVLDPSPATRQSTVLALSRAWPAIRACLQAFSFYDIKEIAGLAGFDLTTLAHLIQKPERGATKGQLMTAVDAGFGKMDVAERTQFLTVVAEEVLRRRPEAQDQLSEYLSRLGWSFSNGTLSPLTILDPSDLPETPPESRADLLKAASRFRDGDLSGAISAACGAVDSATARVYQLQQLGDPGDDSFQQRCRRAAEARGVVPELERQLRSLGWPESEVVPFKKNFVSALNHGAYVMQTLRSMMGDVHGSKPILKSLVFDSMKWAELMVGSLLDRRDDG